MTLQSQSRAAATLQLASSNYAELRTSLKADGPVLRNDVREQQTLLKLVFVSGEKQEVIGASETRLLLLEDIHDSAIKLLSDAGYTNISRVQKALDGDALYERLAGAGRA